MKLSGRLSRNICITLSVATFVFSLPSAFVFDNSSGNCGVVNVGLMQKVHKIYYLLTIVVFVVAFAIVIFSYSNIAVVIMKSKANIEKYSSVTENDHPKIKCLHCITLLCCGRLNYNIISTTFQEPAESGLSNSVFNVTESSTCDDSRFARMVINRPGLTRVKPVNKLAKLKKRLKTTRLTFLPCFIFVLTWTPPWVWYAVANFVKPGEIPYPTFVACNFFLRRSYLINIVTNPLLMISLNENFRKRAKYTCSMLCKIYNK